MDMNTAPIISDITHPPGVKGMVFVKKVKIWANMIIKKEISKPTK